MSDATPFSISCMISINDRNRSSTCIRLVTPDRSPDDLKALGVMSRGVDLGTDFILRVI